MNPFVKENFRLLIFCFACALIMASCDPLETAEPSTMSCEDGVNPNFGNDAYIPDEIKDAIFTPPAGYRNVNEWRQRIVIIPFEFPSVFLRNPAVTTESIRDFFFGVNNGSLNDYFLYNSTNDFRLEEGFITPVITMDQDTAFYNSDNVWRHWANSNNLKRELCQKAATLGVNWSEYDVNNDNIVDAEEVQIVLIPFVGRAGAARSGDFTIQPPNSNNSIRITNQFVFSDAKRVDQPNAGIDALEYNKFTFAHELCHGLFGLPDRYGSGGICGTGTSGQYDLMSDNCINTLMNPIDKIWLGWSKPYVTGHPESRPNPGRYCYEYETSETFGPTTSILWHEDAPDEFWVIEIRNKDLAPHGFDDGIPKSGIVVWWTRMGDRDIHLIDASEYNNPPYSFEYTTDGYSYNAAYAATGVTDSIPSMLLYPSVSRDWAAFELRNVSPAGRTMYLEY